MSDARRNVVATKKAPAAIGPYSQGVIAGGFLFCSGQIALDPISGSMISQGQLAPEDAVRAETERVMENVRAVLEAAGSSFEKVVKSTIFLTSMSDFALVNEVYGRYFPHDPPARSTVQVAALPRGARVEIEVIAHV